MHHIKEDVDRFENIVKGKAREELKKHLKSGNQVIPTNKGNLKVPLNDIETPKIKFKGEDDDEQGVGQGSGEAGDGDGEEQEGEGNGEAGDNAGNKELEAEFTPEEISQFLKDELELPDIENKGDKAVDQVKLKYKTLGDQGPDSLKNFGRTFNNAIKRQIGLGEYDPKNPKVIPIRADFKYRSSVSEVIPMASATVVYIMDVSGSMGDEQKETVRTQAFWMNSFLKGQYKELSIRYIIHDADAKEVNEEDFFRTKESGGTLISKAYLLLKKIMEEEKIRDNVYVFQFSDGDNWSEEDNDICTGLLESYFLPIINLFGYGQVESKWGSGAYYKILNPKFGDRDDVVLTKMKNKSDIYDSIKKFLGKGR